MFTFVCVDTNKYKLPTCITHVPTIITKQKDVLTDRYLVDYLEMLNNKKVEPVEEISPYSLSTPATYSSSYTYLTENGYDNDGRVSLQNETIGKNSYGMLGAEAHIFAPHDNESTSNKSGKFDDSIYESYVNNRNADDETLKKNQQRYVT